MSVEKDTKALVQSQFGRTADKYVSSESHSKTSDLARIVEWLHPEANWVALDVATGGGHVAKTLSPLVKNVYATDLTKAMLNAAQAHLENNHCSNVHYVIADAEMLPFLDEYFDVVTCRIAAHHFPNPEKFVQESARVLKQGGLFVLIDNVSPNNTLFAEYLNTFEKIRDTSHVRCASIPEWESWLRTAGFEIENAAIHKKTLSFHSWASRMVQSEEQLAGLVGFLLSGSNDAKKYFDVQVQDNEIRSLQIDEWMALAVKN